MWETVSVNIRLVCGMQCQLALGLLVVHSVS